MTGKELFRPFLVKADVNIVVAYETYGSWRGPYGIALAKFGVAGCGEGQWLACRNGEQARI